MRWKVKTGRPWKLARPGSHKGHAKAPLDLKGWGPAGADAKAATRTCGTCTVCCTVKGVPGVTDQWSKCAHADTPCASGCAVYQVRPQACKDWLCFWRQGVMGEDDRPDKSGVLIEMETHGAMARMTPAGDGVFLVAREWRPGSLQQYVVQFQAAAQLCPVLTYSSPVHGLSACTLYSHDHPEGTLVTLATSVKAQGYKLGHQQGGD